MRTEIEHSYFYGVLNHCFRRQHDSFVNFTFFFLSMAADFFFSSSLFMTTHLWQERKKSKTWTELKGFIYTIYSHRL